MVKAHANNDKYSSFKIQEKITLIKKNSDTPPIVAIGASAGGLEAIEEFFDNIHGETGFAFVIIQHLSPDFPSYMHEILGRRTEKEIRYIESEVTFQADVVYLLPARKHLEINPPSLSSKKVNDSEKLFLPIDHFLISLAKNYANNTIAIILSGTGTDGTKGGSQLSEAGGLLIAQEPSSCVFDGMPRSIIATGKVEYICEPSEMPYRIFDQESNNDEDLASSLEIETDFNPIYEMLLNSFGVDFRYYKRSSIVRKFEKMMQVHQANNPQQFVTFLQDEPSLKRELLQELLVGVTQFFRDEDAFTALEYQIVIPLVRSKQDGESIRIWICGCSTGQEIYSIAILFSEHIEKSGKDIELKLFGSDIDEVALTRASVGEYSEKELASLSPTWKSKYFVEKGSGYKVHPDLRKKVIFSEHDILAKPPFTRMDLISCRNVMIYLTPEAQSTVISTFYFSLKRGWSSFSWP